MTNLLGLPSYYDPSFWGTAQNVVVSASFVNPINGDNIGER